MQYDGLEEAGTMTDQRVANLMKLIHSLVQEDTTGAVRRDGIDMLSLLIHPRSFTQTVENIFDFSFSLKAGVMGVAVSPNTGLPRAGTYLCQPRLAVEL